MSLEQYIAAIGEEQIDKVIRFRVRMGVDLFTAVEAVVKEKKIRNGIIIGNSGALASGETRNVKRIPAQYPIQADDRLYFPINKPMELLSLSGWIAPDEKGEPFIHMHGTVSVVDESGEKVLVNGGHVERGKQITWLSLVVSIVVFSGDSSGMAVIDPDIKAKDLAY